MNLESAKVRRAAEAFIAWLQRNGLESHDPYDVWGTRYGLWARRLYYEKRRAGSMLVAPLVAAEVLFPGAARRFVAKQRYATAEAQLALAFLNLYAVDGADRHRTAVQTILQGLLDLSIPGYSGHCWGYPFDWQNNRGLWKRDTPFITSTPYCFEAFVEAADLLDKPEYLDVAASIARFVARDLHDTPVSGDASAGSYSPIDRTQVVNASAYRAFVLFNAWQRFGVDEYREIAEGNLRFVLNSQRDDGSWLYALESPAEAFIDHFHTCFVLKNLHKVNAVIGRRDVEAAIDRGWDFYRRALFHADDSPRSFTIEPRLQLARIEMYNFAEAITLGVHLGRRHPDAYVLAQRLARRAIDDYQLSSGCFVTREYIGGLRHTTPFLRWPQAQMFLALTSLLRALQSSSRYVDGGREAARESTTVVPLGAS